MWTTLEWIGIAVAIVVSFNVFVIGFLVFVNRNRMTWPEGVAAEIRALPEIAEPSLLL
jgi:hypothetical protein